MMQQMAATEWDEWQAFARLEPFGEPLADFRIARLQATLIHSVNVALASFARQAPPSPPDPLDLMPDYSGDIAATKEERLLDKVKGWVSGWQNRHASRNEIQRERMED